MLKAFGYGLLGIAVLLGITGLVVVILAGSFVLPFYAYESNNPVLWVACIPFWLFIIYCNLCSSSTPID